MHCDGPLDSAIHEFVDCPTIQRNVWCFCMPTLRKLVNGRGVPMDARSVVLGWQDLRMPDALHSRLLLWRDLAIHLLSRCCLAAITAGLQNNHWPQLSLEDFDREHAALVVYIITTAYDLCSDAQHPAFVGKWIKQGALLMEENRTLVFQPIQAAAPAQRHLSYSQPITTLTFPLGFNCGSFCCSSPYVCPLDPSSQTCL